MAKALTRTTAAPEAAALLPEPKDGETSAGHGKNRACDRLWGEPGATSLRRARPSPSRSGAPRAGAAEPADPSGGWGGPPSPRAGAAHLGGASGSAPGTPPGRAPRGAPALGRRWFPGSSRRCPPTPGGSRGEAGGQ